MSILKKLGSFIMKDILGIEAPEIPEKTDAQIAAEKAAEAEILQQQKIETEELAKRKRIRKADQLAEEMGLRGPRSLMTSVGGYPGKPMTGSMFT
jgi:hypothetical protein